MLSPLLLGQTGLFFLYHSGEPGTLLGLLALELAFTYNGIIGKAVKFLLLAG